VPDIGGASTKAKGNTIRSLNELLNEFDAGEHNSGILERLKSEHGRGAKFYATVILLYYIVQVLAAADLNWIAHRKLNSCRIPLRRRAV
jgi:hypothetical protein